jgi:ketosteroid isomerase-like protein
MLEMHGRAREGLDVTREIAVLMTFRNGKIVDYVGGMDRAAALEAAGPSE